MPARKRAARAARGKQADRIGWRICRAAHAEQPLDGVGGLYVSGRWHHRGRRIVYASDSAALAALEVLVHVDPATAPPDLVLTSFRVTGVGLDAAAHGWSREFLDAEVPGWRDVPAPAELRDLGSTWLQQGSSLCRVVPSALVPDGDNLLINPEHPDAARLEVIGQQPFQFDARLL